MPTNDGGKSPPMSSSTEKPSDESVSKALSTALDAESTLSRASATQLTKAFREEPQSRISKKTSSELHAIVASPLFDLDCAEFFYEQCKRL